jgi:dTDP-4-dehydrorhamnose 3,5-epimerase-like enzyme
VTHKININTKSPQLIKIQSISDDRGYLIPFTDYIDHELFHRCYVVGDYGRGIIRGLHYHKQEMKIFTIVSGAAKFVTIKIPEDMADRNDTKEINKYLKENPELTETFVLSSRHHGVVIVPAYFANGWISLEDNTILVSLSNLRFEKAKNDDIRIDPYVVSKEIWEVVGR